jgi:RND family efflux transporter MFP subunit
LACAAAIAQPSMPVVARDQAPPTSLALDKDGRIRTQFSAPNAVTLSAEVPARIASLPLREGDSFRAGQLLVGFDCSLLHSQQRKAEAAVEAMNALLQSNLRLAELNSIGKYELEQTQARLKEAQAEAAGARVLVARCSITAPFAGRIAKRLAAQYQYVSPGTPLLDIRDTGELELQMIVPSKWLAWLKPGAPFSVDVDELGKRVPAKVRRLGAQIDPVSQSIAVFGVIDGNALGLLPGMSGWAVFPSRQ